MYFPSSQKTKTVSVVPGDSWKDHRSLSHENSDSSNTDCSLLYMIWYVIVIQFEKGASSCSFTLSNDPTSKVDYALRSRGSVAYVPIAPLFSFFLSFLLTSGLHLSGISSIRPAWLITNLCFTLTCK